MAYGLAEFAERKLEFVELPRQELAKALLEGKGRHRYGWNDRG